MNRNSSIVTLEESEIVFDHIIKNKVPSEKTFYEYFVPCSLNSKAYNPLL